MPPFCDALGSVEASPHAPSLISLPDLHECVRAFFTVGAHLTIGALFTVGALLTVGAVLGVCAHFHQTGSERAICIFVHSELHRDDGSRGGLQGS